MSTLKGTGKFINATELFTVVQLSGKYHSDRSQENKIALNKFLQNLGLVYKYNWLHHQIKPDTGEVIEVIE